MAVVKNPLDFSSCWLLHTLFTSSQLFIKKICWCCMKTHFKYVFCYVHRPALHPLKLLRSCWSLVCEIMMSYWPQSSAGRCPSCPHWRPSGGRFLRSWCWSSSPQQSHFWRLSLWCCWNKTTFSNQTDDSRHGDVRVAAKTYNLKCNPRYEGWFITHISCFPERPQGSLPFFCRK